MTKTKKPIDAGAAGSLQAALDRLPAAGGTVYLPAGEYVVDATLRLALAEKQHFCLRGEGRASVVRFTAEDGSPLLRLDGVPDSWWPDLRITIQGLSFIGNHQCGDALHLRWPNDALVDACFFEGFGGTAVVVTPNATNVTIRDCWMRDCRRALHADNLHHLTFHGNQTRSSNRAGLRQREHLYIGRHCREVRIVNNHLAYGHAEAIVLDGTAQHVIANNTIEGFPVGIRAVECRDIAINANYIHCPVGVLMEGDNRGLVITANIMTENSEAAIRVRDAGTSGGHVIAANIMRSSVYPVEPAATAAQGGVDLGEAEDCVVAENVLEDLEPGAGPAIRARHPERNALTGNLVADTAGRAAKRLGPRPENRPDDAMIFAPLREYFRRQPPEVRRLSVTLHQVNAALDGELPPEAFADSAWWTNDPATPQAAAWLEAGWLVAIVKRIEGRIVFARIPDFSAAGRSSAAEPGNHSG